MTSEWNFVIEHLPSCRGQKRKFMMIQRIVPVMIGLSNLLPHCPSFDHRLCSWNVETRPPSLWLRKVLQDEYWPRAIGRGPGQRPMGVIAWSDPAIGAANHWGCSSAGDREVKVGCLSFWLRGRRSSPASLTVARSFGRSTLVVLLLASLAVVLRRAGATTSAARPRGL